MTRSIKSLLIVFACVVISNSAGMTQTPPSVSTEETAVRQIVQEVQEGWNAHDGKAFAARFAADADYVIVNGMKTKGREAIEKGHAQIFSTIYRESHNVATIQSVRFLRPDVAVVHVEWNLEFTTGGGKQKARAMNSMVMTKDNHKWSIAVFQNTPIDERGR